MAPRASLILLLTLSAGGFGATPAWADVFYGGIAYLGDHSFIESNYPLTRHLNEPTGEIDRRLRSMLDQSPPQHLTLRHGLADLNRSETVVLAVAVDQERIVKEVFDFGTGPQTKLIVEISLQLLFYDFESNTLIDNQPISAAINQVLEGNVANVDTEARKLASMLYGLADGDGLLLEIAQTLQDYHLGYAQPRRFQMADIALHPRVTQFLPEGLSEAQWRQSIGQFFSAQLSHLVHVEVIPFNRGYALGNQLPGRFANGEVFGLTLPEPDFRFALEIKNLTKHSNSDKLAHGSQVRFSFEEPFTGTTFIDGDYRLAVSKLSSDARILEDDWSAWQDAVEDLLEALITQLQKPNRQWHREHARETDSYELFRKKKELFNG